MIGAGVAVGVICLGVTVETEEGLGFGAVVGSVEHKAHRPISLSLAYLLASVNLSWYFISG